MQPVHLKSLYRIVLVVVSLTTAIPAKADFPLKNGDVWVMAGDSITAQHLHSNYFEAFCFARYPQLKFVFRNSGVSGRQSGVVGRGRQNEPPGMPWGR